jgi:hypothetical protein
MGNHPIYPLAEMMWEDVMASKGQMTGMLGVYLVAAELSLKQKQRALVSGRGPFARGRLISLPVTRLYSDISMVNTGLTDPDMLPT